jgi:tetratricopeptide (TPR) repeat protein
VAPVSTFSLARTMLMRALILRSMEKWTEAADMARLAAADFRQYGDVAKYFSARMSEAIVLYDSSQYRKAIAVYTELAPFQPQISGHTLGLALHNEGLCHREMGDFAQAETCFVRAIALCDRLQMTFLRAKAHWHLARVLMRQAKYDGALKILNPLRGDFEELGMSHDLACASIDMAESLLALDRPKEVAVLCRQAIEYFRGAGLAYSSGAMTALAYLQEASADGRLTVGDVDQVRVYFERLPREPNVVFARPVR